MTLICSNQCLINASGTKLICSISLRWVLWFWRIYPCIGLCMFVVVVQVLCHWEHSLTMSNCVSVYHWQYLVTMASCVNVYIIESNYLLWQVVRVSILLTPFTYCGELSISLTAFAYYGKLCNCQYCWQMTAFTYYSELCRCQSNWQHFLTMASCTSVYIYVIDSIHLLCCVV